MSVLLDHPRIHTLPEQLANQIAAGEVVERPSSVVKELLENALDAGARQIRLDIDRGGMTKISIRDDGHGLHPDDLERALQRHTTSKIRDEKDLHCIQSLGFRGEALAAIASVSRLRLETSDNEQARGAVVSTRGSEIVELAPIARSRGTTVSVEDLFFNTPARRKFLRSEATEYQHIQAIVRQIALSHFETGFTMHHNGRRVMHYPATETDYARRVRDILGKQFLQQSRQLEASREELRLWGWLGDPALARNQSDRQFVFLNGRGIRDKKVSHAIRVAFADRIYTGRFPAYVLYLEMSPELADINVHPSKHEVRFQRARDVHDFIHAGIANALGHPALQESERVSSPGVFTPPKNSIHESRTDYLKQNVVTSMTNRDSSLGKFHSTIQQRFIVLEDSEGMVLFDIFAARELVAHHAIEQSHTGIIPTRKPLLFPISISATSDLLDQCVERLDVLTPYGIDIQRTGPEQITLKQLPVFLKYAHAETLIQSLLVELQTQDPDLQKVEKIVSCHVNDQPESFDRTEQEKLINECTHIIQQSPTYHRPWRNLSLDQLTKLVQQ